MTATLEYTGNLRTACIHVQSNTTIITDAPTDNHGKGEAFSPTDLVATSLASCMLTTMGIAITSTNIDINGTKATVKKVMANDPRRIAAIEVEISFPRSYSDETITLLKDKAVNCPVAKSLHPDIQQVTTFKFA